MAGAGTSGSGSNNYDINVLSCKSIWNNAPSSQVAVPPRQNLLSKHVSFYLEIPPLFEGSGWIWPGTIYRHWPFWKIHEPSICSEMINHRWLLYQVCCRDCSPAGMWPAVSTGQLPADENFQTSTGSDSELGSGQRFQFWEISFRSLLELIQCHDPISVYFRGLFQWTTT